MIFEIFSYDLEVQMKEGGTATEEDLEMIDSVISGPINDIKNMRDPGLGSHMKDDLGSYRNIAISAKHF